MHKLFTALVMVALTTPALADGNGGPQAPNDMFLVWQQEGAAGKTFTPPKVLVQRATPEQLAQANWPKTR